jgi:hypothetical protein
MSPSSDTTTPTAPPGPPPVRASDDDRAATVRVLQDAVARGLLTAEEGGERMAAAFAAVHLRDLPPLTADLRPAATAAPARTAPGWCARGDAARPAPDVAAPAGHHPAAPRPGRRRGRSRTARARGSRLAGRRTVLRRRGRARSRRFRPPVRPDAGAGWAATSAPPAAQSVVGGSRRGRKTSSMGRGPTYCRQVQGTHEWPDQRPRRSNVSRRSSA